MQDIPPWVRGPIELILHAEGHFMKHSDIDKRLALISFDNAIEVTITTYLQLKPKIRSGKAYPREDTEKWLKNYHSKIRFLEHFSQEMGVVLNTSIEEIIWYHTLRNELYHSGNGMVPEVHCIEGVRKATFEVMDLIFNIDTKELVISSVSIESQPETENIATAQNSFLQAFINLHRTLHGTALALGLEVDQLKEFGNPFALWRTLGDYLGDKKNLFDEFVQQSIKVRNKMIYSGISGCSDEELKELTEKLNQLANSLQSHGFSFNVLPSLMERYGDWVDPKISNVRIVQKSGDVFLEITRLSKGLYDEEIKRVNLGFIINDIEEDIPLFSSNYSAQDNAERFFEELDLYSIMMTGIGDILFRKEVLDSVLNYCTDDEGQPSNDIYRRA